MKRLCILTIVAALDASVVNFSHSQTKMLWVNGDTNSGSIKLEDEVRIEAQETLEVMYSSGDVLGEYSGPEFRKTFWFLSTPPLPVLTGPGLLRIYDPNCCHTSIVTVRITPGPQSPDKTIILQPGFGAAVTFQSSTNLVDWQAAVSGVYTNVPSAMFFRIKVDRYPW